MNKRGFGERAIVQLTMVRFREFVREPEAVFCDIGLPGGMDGHEVARTLRAGNKFGHTELTDEMLYDGLTNVYTNELMGELAEYTAEKAGITGGDIIAPSTNPDSRE